MIKTALISVSDKTGIVDFARQLDELGIKIISTGRTAELLRKNKINVTLVSEVAKFHEMLDGRVKSFHPNIFAGILADKKNKKHMNELKQRNIAPIDLVVINFYPFEEACLKGARLKDIIENIDIGGPALARAAAKNFKNVLVIIEQKDYGQLIERLKSRKIDEKFRSRLAAKAFLEVARYSVIIGRYFANEILDEQFPEIYNFSFRKIQDLRYGENPQQKGAFYKSFFVPETCVSTAKQLQGKELSYNNILDANDAFELVKEFNVPTAAVIKHTNPSGVASASSIGEAYRNAYETDRKSAFGGVVALNRPCNLDIAKVMKPLFVEVVICPKYENNAFDVLKEKKNLRLLETGPIIKDYKSPDLRRVVGGLLVQTRQVIDIKEKDLKFVTRRKPTKEEMRDLIFAWRVNKHVKSNSIVLAKNNVTIGIGAGQMSRVDAVTLAVMKSEGKSIGTVMSSDAFFPFRDGVDEAANAGITAIIQPGGSIKDKEVIDAANENEIAMVFTGIRLFKH